MQSNKANIINQLQKDILSLQGFKPASPGSDMKVGLGVMEQAFPNGTFPLGAVHEFLCPAIEDTSATAGFIAGLLSSIMKSNGVTLWISASRTIFPPALKLFGIQPEQVIFVDLQKEKEVLWALEEALKCDGLAAVVGELQEMSFTASRRLQLAVEQSRVTGFILRSNLQKLTTTACVSRWKIRSVPSETGDDLPGVGFPRWNVELLKVRNGKPGMWDVEWKEGHFYPVVERVITIAAEQIRKTG